MQDFGKNVVIVSDGCPQKTKTKDQAHKSRAKSTGIEPDVQVTATTKLAIKKDYFKTHKTNKIS